MPHSSSVPKEYPSAARQEVIRNESSRKSYRWRVEKFTSNQTNDVLDEYAKWQYT
jgi:hypothetical protein